MRLHKDYLAIIRMIGMDQLMVNYFLKSNRKIHPDEYVLQVESVLARDIEQVGLGIILYQNGVQIWGKSMVVPGINKLEACYSGIILGLEGALERGITNILVIGSGLGIKQLRGDEEGEYHFGSEQVFKNYLKTKELAEMFSIIRFREVATGGKAFEMAKTIIL